MRKLALVLLLVLLPAGAAQSATTDGAVFYVVTSGNLYTYQVGTWKQTAHSTLPFKASVRGTAFDTSRHSLYITYGGRGGPSGNGSILRYDLLTGTTIWNLHLTHGVDMPAACNNLVYVPGGAQSTATTWYILDADTGAQVGTLQGGTHPHNTICHHNHIYMGGIQDRYLYATRLPRSGPAPTAGVRPFTVNSGDTRAYITWSDFRGYSIADLLTGRIIRTITFGAVPAGTPATDALSHGISLSPDDSEVYVLDRPSETVRVYDAADTATRLATITLQHPIAGSGEGWLLHSLDGRYVWVGDSGDVIDTRSRTVTGHLPALASSRHGFVEVIWTNGAATATSTHFGVGF